MSGGTATLGYASAGVKSAPPRTFFRLTVHAIGKLLVLLLLVIQLLVLLAGHLVLGIAFLARHLITAIGKLLLMLGRLHWSNVQQTCTNATLKLVRPIVKSFNRVSLFFARLSGRAQHVPFAAMHAPQ